MGVLPKLPATVRKPRKKRARTTPTKPRKPRRRKVQRQALLKINPEIAGQSGLERDLAAAAAAPKKSRRRRSPAQVAASLRNLKRARKKAN
jgi:hypothetical protein